jgi:hypothetical protein
MNTFEESQLSVQGKKVCEDSQGKKVSEDSSCRTDITFHFHFSSSISEESELVPVAACPTIGDWLMGSEIFIFLPPSPKNLNLFLLQRALQLVIG